ncbi:MAG: 7-cyano-7-deazaguanine synthase QueC, partial [Acidobacteriota bacterium]
SFRYGQRHARELRASARLARAFAVPRRVVTLDLRDFGRSALTSDTPVPKGRSRRSIGRGIPSTYVPARNTIFLAIALAHAETIGARDVFIGVNALDYSGYPDCRPEYLRAFEKLARLATRAGVRGARLAIHAPLLRMSKAQIVAEGARLGVDFAMTWSCYDPAPRGRACGACDACQLRLEGFAGAGLADPLRYA